MSKQKLLQTLYKRNDIQSTMKIRWICKMSLPKTLKNSYDNQISGRSLALELCSSWEN